MIDLLRRISLCNRVLYLSFGMAALLLGIGGYGATRLQAGNDPAAAMAVLVIATGGASLGVFLGWMMRLSIKDPVEDTIQAMIRIAHGDLETKVSSPGRDEISWLRSEMNGMRKKLRTMVLEVRSSVDSVATAADEIARGNSDLSARTESQAAALQQTSSSMNHLADTVRSNAQHASGASDEVRQASDVAQRGGKLMSDVEKRMQDIHTSANRINEIIGVIDGIAFQTNILALNAAVEAARAGEQGRGFAVVAAEVRSLAQRCAAAAREVKTLIGDSSDKVDAGAALVGEAGKTMQELLQRISRVSGMVTDIAHAGSSQSDGIGQVHAAVAQIDDVTQQNAALVEEAAAAAQSLREQAGRLSQTMSAFQVVA
ncbi:methyl-accepting chemotaxis protein [Burkholderiales bacterium JOSHI_001]|nr:methyl-accepting chemotaxis protein [Burkholderiales bacterium JOSHI_001]